MRKAKIFCVFAVGLALVLLSSALLADAPEAAGQGTPITLQDILAWKTIGTSAVSDDGAWLAYRITPTEGDAEVVVRQTRGDKEFRFPAGETGGNDLAFSDDSKWVAFSASPTKKEADQLRKGRKPVQNKVLLVDLSTGKETTFEKTRRFAFSGEKGGWVALQKFGADGAAPAAGGPAAGGPPPTPGPSGAATAASDRPRGSDVILRDLATGAELNIGNVVEFAFDRPGRRLAFVIDAQDKSGNGVVVRDLETGAVRALDSDKASYERLAWTEAGDALAVLKGKEDKAYQDKLYSLVGVTFGAGGAPQTIVFDPAADKTFPEGMTISANRTPTWLKDLSAVLIGIQKARKKDPKAGAESGEKKEGEASTPTAQPPAEASADEKPDLVLWHWLDRRLQSQQQVQEDADKRFSYLSVFRVKDRKFVRLADDEVRDVTAGDRSKWAVGSDAREYERMGGMDGRNYRDVYAINLETGARSPVMKKARYFYGASPDASRLLYYDAGAFFVYDCASGKAANITRTVPTSFVNADDDHNVVNPPVSPIGWVSDASAVWLSDGWDIWQVPVAGGTATNLTADGKKNQVRYRRRYALDRDERGIDVTRPQYVGTYGEWTKKSGIVRIDPGKPGVTALAWDDASYSRLLKPRRADLFVFSRETDQAPPDLHAADLTLGGARKLTALDALQKPFAWSSGARLVDYTVTLGKGAKPKKLQAALFLPANYEKGKAYPTIVYIYEKLSQGLNTYTVPTANGFNKSYYTSNGYAVLMPDITYRLNDPGMSAVWCVLPALRAAVATGVVDAKKVGLQGHSWGGYQSSFLATQTSAFAAIVTGAPLTNMVSMYSLIYKNSGLTNQGIFESSQGRFFGPYNENWEAYIRNSPVVFAKNVTTPMVILHNDRDGAVDFTQGIEYFNTLRRLGKEVVLLEYVGENHGLVKPANRKDYTVRMKEFFDHKLMGRPAPEWYTKGVSRLDMDEHLKGRADLVKAAEPKDAKPKEKAPRTPTPEKK